MKSYLFQTVNEDINKYNELEVNHSILLKTDILSIGYFSYDMYLREGEIYIIGSDKLVIKIIGKIDDNEVLKELKDFSFGKFRVNLKETFEYILPIDNENFYLYCETVNDTFIKKVVDSKFSILNEICNNFYKCSVQKSNKYFVYLKDVKYTFDIYERLKGIDYKTVYPKIIQIETLLEFKENDIIDLGKDINRHFGYAHILNNFDFLLNPNSYLLLDGRSVHNLRHCLMFTKDSIKYQIFVYPDFINSFVQTIQRNKNIEIFNVLGKNLFEITFNEKLDLKVISCETMNNIILGNY